MKICVYCSASEDLEKVFYEAGENFGKLIAERGHGLVYGGYSKGVMASVAEAVYAGKGEITAVVPDIFDRSGFTYEGCTEIIRTKTMAERKSAMENEADAIAILPGGIGTMDEFFSVFVLSTLGQYDRPIAVLNTAGFYDTLEQLLDEFVKKGFLSKDARECAVFFKEPEKLIAYLENKDE